MQWLGAAVAAIVIVWTLVPLLRHEAWWIRVFDFPRLQIAVATLVAIGLYIATAGLDSLADYIWVGALFACFAFQLVRIAPYTFLNAKEAKDAANVSPTDSIKILVANVLTPNRNADALLRIVESRHPDVLLFVETDEWWQSKLDVLEAEYPYTVKHPSDNLYGMHLYSKLELVEPTLQFLVEDDVPSIHSGLMLRSGHCVQIHCVHPTPPAPGENSSSAERDAELLVVGKSVAAEDRTAIVLGDLNDVAWSDTTRLFQKMSGLLDPRIGRGMFSTFHAKYPFLRWPLDHIFFTSDFTVVSLARLPPFGSDHFPIFAWLSHTPAAEAVQKEPKPDADDREHAEEKIDQVDVKETPQPSRIHSRRFTPSQAALRAS